MARKRASYIYDCLTSSLGFFGVSCLPDAAPSSVVVKKKSQKKIVKYTSIKEAVTPTSNHSFETLSDGNCAYNSIALFLRDHLLDLESAHAQGFSDVLFEHSSPLREMVLNQPNLSSLEKRQQLRAFLITLSQEEVQQLLSPVLRTFVVEEMINEKAHYQDVYGDQLNELIKYVVVNEIEYVVSNKPNIPYADVFLVHAFIDEYYQYIQAQFPLNLEQQQEAMSVWWIQEGFDRYLDAIQTPATSALDMSRWGGANELDILGQLFHIDIRYTKNNRGSSQLGDNQSSAICFLRINGAHWFYDGWKQRTWQIYFTETWSNYFNTSQSASVNAISDEHLTTHTF